MDKLQHTFDTVVRHLASQGRRSARITDSGRRECLYLAPNGDRCAVGALFDRRKTQQVKRAEGMGTSASPVQSLIRWEFVVRAGSLGATLRDEYDWLGLLKDLQGVHDEDDPSAWPRSLGVVADAYGLSTDVLDAVEWSEPV